MDEVLLGAELRRGVVAEAAIHLVQRGVIAGGAAHYFRSDDNARTFFVDLSRPGDAKREADRNASRGAVSLKNLSLSAAFERQQLVQAAREDGLKMTGHLETGFLEFGLSLAMEGYTGAQHIPVQVPLYEDVARFLGQANFAFNDTLGEMGLVRNNGYFLQQGEYWKDPKLRRFLTPGEQPMGPMGALEAASLHGAQFLGAQKDIGTLEVGKLADLIVLDANLRWARAHAISLSSVEPQAPLSELGFLREWVGSAKVVGLGEAAHGKHEFLALRNRLFRYLVENLGFTAIALETDFAEAMRIDDYVTGKMALTPELVASVWSFGAPQAWAENHSLIEWMRAWNARQAPGRQIHFYGLEMMGHNLSIPRPLPGRALDAALEYLEEVDPPQADAMRRRVGPLLEKISSRPYVIDGHAPNPYDELGVDAQNALTAHIADLVSLFQRRRVEWSDRSSPREYERAYRSSLNAQALDADFRVRGWWLSRFGDRNQRAATSAENLLWTLSMGGSGRVFLFYHGSHLAMPGRSALSPGRLYVPYPIGSISKPYTATALMILAERGKLRLEAPINDYLGEHKLVAHTGDARDATVLRVASHSAGLPVHWQFFYEDQRLATPDMEETIRRYGHIVRPPGEAYVYSNFGFGLLGYVVERVSGRPYEEFMRDEVFKPLGMHATGTLRSPDLRQRMAVRYARNGVVVPAFEIDTPAAGSTFSSVHDLLRFGMFHLKDHLPGQQRVLTDASIDAMSRPAVRVDGDTTRGIGWGMHEVRGLHIVSHAGSLTGGSARLALIPSHDIAIAIATNTEKTLLPIESAIINALLLETIRNRGDMRLPAALVGRWQGTISSYERDTPVRLDVEADGRVWIRVGGAQPEEVVDVTLKETDQRYELSLGGIAGDIGKGDVMRFPYLLSLNLVLREDVLDGAATAFSRAIADRDGSALSYWARLERAARER